MPQRAHTEASYLKIFHQTLKLIFENYCAYAISNLGDLSPRQALRSLPLTLI